MARTILIEEDGLAEFCALRGNRARRTDYSPGEWLLGSHVSWPLKLTLVPGAAGPHYCGGAPGTVALLTATASVHSRGGCTTPGGPCRPLTLTTCVITEDFN